MSSFAQKSCVCEQARIAAVNTALTALGMWAMAIPGIGLLSMFVFICSFIPIAGVFVSTVPIAFVALTEYGFIKARSPHRVSASSLTTKHLLAMPEREACPCDSDPLAGIFHCCTRECCSTYGDASAQLALTIAMVTGIHFVEAYLLNPVRGDALSAAYPTCISLRRESETRDDRLGILLI